MTHATQENVLEQIQKGMHVYDRNGKGVGKVEYVQFGDENPTQPGIETVTAQQPPDARNKLLDKALAGAKAEDREPEELRARLLRYGFIRVDPGILRSDRFVLSGQIAGVSGSRVKLSVPRDQLITG
jgi:hypothetical protein